MPFEKCADGFQFKILIQKEWDPQSCGWKNIWYMYIKKKKIDFSITFRLWKSHLLSLHPAALFCFSKIVQSLSYPLQIIRKKHRKLISIFRLSQWYLLHLVKHKKTKTSRLVFLCDSKSWGYSYHFQLHEYICNF